MKTIEYCPKCHGTGVLAVGETGSIPCNRCGGDGQFDIGFVESEEILSVLDPVAERIGLMDGKLDKIMEKLKIE
jgi:RecJ-like exonuclease